MTGLLRITGRIALDQFWPHGTSDADTTKIEVEVTSGSFAFAVDRTSFFTTRAFDQAYVQGASHKRLIDANRRITVRLQGIDAPELHYRAAPLKKGRPGITPAKRQAYNTANAMERRQYLGESATQALARHLATLGGTEINCVVYSLVDHPFEVVDTYGRFVGNIRVGPAFGDDLNLWLVRHGWCFPTFYSSMENEEIEALLAAMRKAGTSNVWKYYSKDTAHFDPDLLYRAPPATPHPAADRGPVLMPKLFRRQVAFAMERKARITAGSFKAFLASRPDSCFELQDFLKAGPHSAVPRQLDEFQTGTTFTCRPHEIVFREKFSTVVDASGQVIRNF
jgi:endonuclease YncB( thermonuclease family)